MQYINLKVLLETIEAKDAGKTALGKLPKAHQRAGTRDDPQRAKYIEDNGPYYWTPIKGMLIEELGNKCWYTEVELVGEPLKVDHYRPVCKYWWLAFDPENYRLSCSFANSPQGNPESGTTGGKGREFPLVDESKRACSKDELSDEKPIFLDPCVEADCDLLAFQTDGRPALKQKYRGDAETEQRVERSLNLLNLVHPDFNSKREQLYWEIGKDIRAYEQLPVGSPSREEIRIGLARRMSPKAPFSVAARTYCSMYRYLDWIDTLLKEPT